MMKAACLWSALGLLSCLLAVQSAHAQGPGYRPNAPETWYDGPAPQAQPHAHQHQQTHHHHAGPAPHRGRAWFGYTREERKDFPQYYGGYRRYDGGFHASYFRNYPGYQQGIYNERYGYGAGWGW